MSAKKRGGIFVATLRNLQVCITNIYSVSPWLTAAPSALLWWALLIFPACFENAYYSKDWCAAYHASVSRPPMVGKRLRQGNRLGGPDYTEHHGFAPGSKRARCGRGNLMPLRSNWCDRRRCRHATSEAGCHKSSLSKADFRWLIVISHKVCFLWLTIVSHNYVLCYAVSWLIVLTWLALACHHYVIIGWCFYDSRLWVIMM